MNHDLRRDIELAFGAQQGAIAAAARALPMNGDNLRQMISGKRPTPDWVWARLGELARLAQIAPPTSLLAEEAISQQ